MENVNAGFTTINWGAMTQPRNGAKGDRKIGVKM